MTLISSVWQESEEVHSNWLDNQTTSLCTRSHEHQLYLWLMRHLKLSWIANKQSYESFVWAGRLSANKNTLIVDMRIGFQHALLLLITLTNNKYLHARLSAPIQPCTQWLRIVNKRLMYYSSLICTACTERDSIPLYLVSGVAWSIRFHDVEVFGIRCFHSSADLRTNHRAHCSQCTLKILWVLKNCILLQTL